MTGNTDNHLTEFVLTVHNEIQTAMTLMETQVRQSGDSEVFLTLDKGTLSFPVFMEITEGIETLNDVEATLDNLSDRSGFLVADNLDTTGVYTKVAVLPPEPGLDPDLLGKIELTFIPTER